MPIPLALVYESYKTFRIDMLVSDRLKQKEALFDCFICMDLTN